MICIILSYHVIIVRKYFFPAVDRINYDNRMIFISICIDMVVNINRRLDYFTESDQNVFVSLLGV